MGLFAAKPPVSEDEFDWLVACFAWLRLILDDTNRQIDCVLPDDARLEAAQTAGALFDIVRVHCDMADWPVELAKIEDDFQATDIREVRDQNGPLGTFSTDGQATVIHYSTALLRNPDALTATFAHELAHYLLEGRGDPPGGADLLEHATDCAAVYLGFGVFLANSARHFEQFTDGEWSGWRSSASGYLSEQALVCATALAAALNGHDTSAIEAQLKPYLRSDFRKARKAIARKYPTLGEALATIEKLAWNYD